MTAVNVAILGAGGFGREVHSWLGDIDATGGNINVLGFLDDCESQLEQFSGLPPILGGMWAAPAQMPSDTKLVCGVGSPELKIKLYNRWSEFGFEFMTVIHPTAIVGQRSQVGPGCVVCPRVVITSDVVVDGLVTINAASTIGHDASIGFGATLSGHVDVTGGAVVGRGGFLGSHAVLAPGVVLGEFAKVGAGSVVIRKVQERATVFGIPAKQIKGF